MLEKFVSIMNLALEPYNLMFDTLEMLPTHAVLEYGEQLKQAFNH